MSYPACVGLTPAHSYGEEWKFTYEMLEQHVNLKGQHALVTGANSGIGYSLVKGLTRLGASSVTLACRNAQKCQNAIQQIRQDVPNKDEVELNTLIMDTSSLQSVQQAALQFVATMNHQNKSLDMLFLNAGTLFLDPLKSCVPVNEDGIEYIFATNYVGHHLLYRLLEPILHHPMARIVSTSSAHSFRTYSYKVATDLKTLNGCSESTWGFPCWNLSYGQTKLAQILWTQELTRRLKSLHSNHLFVNSFHPGMVDTWIWNRVLDQFMDDPPQWALDWLQWFRKDIMWSVDEGTLTGLFLGTHLEYLQTHDIRGKYYHPQGQAVTNPDALNLDHQKALWEFTESLVEDYLVAPTETK